ncbi:MAG: manganese catalase family protein, partial [Paeniclostridium sordellii]|nr:manganese catalase family protein [Paeniclostridium sordellii]
KDILRFLGEREIVHYQRFGEALMDVYEFTESKKIF